MAGRLSTDLAQGYRELGLRTRPGSHVSSRARDSSYANASERALRLQALVELYREGPRQIWAPVLLDLLAPALVARLRDLRLEPPYLDEDDLRQQIVVELLEAAAHMRLPAEPRFLRRWLLARANQNVRRRLQRERRRQRGQASLDRLQEAGRR